MLWENDSKKRRPFSTKTKKMEWMSSAGKDPLKWRSDFVQTSKCRKCHVTLRWGDRRYDFDHKDNNPSNNSQSNCFLVCKNCHGHATLVKKRKIKGFLGETVGHQTIKKKIGYKKPKKKPEKTKRVAVRDVFGNVTGYRTVQIRKTKNIKKSTERAGSSKAKKATRKTKNKTTKTKRKKKSSVLF